VRPAPLDRDEIVGAALKVLDQDGLAALTMRRIGRELDVEAMALYRHFPNKEALIDGVAAHLLDLVELPDPEAVAWRHGLHQVAHSYREIALTHPVAFRLLATRRTPGNRLFDIAQCLLRLLERGGIANDAGVRTYHALLGLVHGATVIELVLAGDPPDPSASGAPSPDTHPLVVANLDELMACIAGENLDELVDQVIDGASAPTATASRTRARPGS
jgi:AcrR family transcriptional regulator